MTRHEQYEGTREYYREYYARNRERILARQRKARREAVLTDEERKAWNEYWRLYRQANAERCREYQRKCYRRKREAESGMNERTTAVNGE